MIYASLSAPVIEISAMIKAISKFHAERISDCFIGTLYMLCLYPLAHV